MSSPLIKVGVHKKLLNDKQAMSSTLAEVGVRGGGGEPLNNKKDMSSTLTKVGVQEGIVKY